MSKRYQKILLAVDFHEDMTEVVDTAREMAELYSAELFIAHVNEPLGLAYSAEGMSWGEQVYALEAGIRTESLKKLKELSTRLGVAESNCHFLEGRPATRLHELSVEKNIDLVILGTHGQSGLQLLLGSTANSVLHGSACDVLAIRVSE